MNQDITQVHRFLSSKTSISLSPLSIPELVELVLIDQGIIK